MNKLPIKDQLIVAGGTIIAVLCILEIVIWLTGG